MKTEKSEGRRKFCVFDPKKTTFRANFSQKRRQNQPLDTEQHPRSGPAAQNLRAKQQKNTRDAQSLRRKEKTRRRICATKRPPCSGCLLSPPEIFYRWRVWILSSRPEFRLSSAHCSHVTLEEEDVVLQLLFLYSLGLEFQVLLESLYSLAVSDRKSTL